ncbi:MAG: GNAT family N-acetyltransferase [Bacteroidota bacterium]
MMNQIEIRTVALSDTKGIAELNLELGYQTSNDVVEKQLKEVLATNDHYVLIAMNQEEIAGYIHAFRAVRLTTDTFIEIGALIVKGNYRNQGIGKQLVEHLQREVKDMNKIRVRCNVKRMAAHSFYSSLNFEEKKEQKIFDRKMGYDK